MSKFIVKELEALGVKVRTVDLGRQVLDGQDIQLPPAILGSIGDDPKKRTIQLYAHYDVQPVSTQKRRTGLGARSSGLRGWDKSARPWNVGNCEGLPL